LPSSLVEDQELKRSLQMVGESSDELASFKRILIVSDHLVNQFEQKESQITRLENESAKKDA
jgi:hypothetical protein